MQVGDGGRQADVMTSDLCRVHKFARDLREARLEVRDSQIDSDWALSRFYSNTNKDEITSNEDGSSHDDDEADIIGSDEEDHELNEKKLVGEGNLTKIHNSYIYVLYRSLMLCGWQKLSKQIIS